MTVAAINDAAIMETGLKALFAALGAANMERFISAINENPMGYTELRHLWLDADSEGLTTKEFFDKIATEKIPYDLPPIGSGLSSGNPLPPPWET